MNHITKSICAVLLSLCLMIAAGIFCIAEPSDDSDLDSSSASTEVSSSESSSDVSDTESQSQASSSEEESEESSQASSSSSSPSSTESRTSTSYFETSAAAPDETEDEENDDRYIGTASDSSSKSSSRARKNNKTSDVSDEVVSSEVMPVKKNISSFGNAARILFFIPVLLALVCIFFLIRFNVMASKANKARARKKRPTANEEVSLDSFATNKKSPPRGGRHYK